ncbi:hypothetical protein PLICRDRAFT_61225, partial [Plicaturopsis crispa FD-325 SS-3]
TLHNRFQGLHNSSRAAHAKEQRLTTEQEKCLVDWATHLSDQGRPLTKHSLIRMVQHLSDSYEPATGLDPKRAQAFNRATVDDHFTKLGDVLDREHISWRNVYNMDEKGCQRGGGRKANSIKYLVPRNRRPKCKLRSANLKLVTIIECVCADGSSLLPGFIFSGKELLPEWFQVDDGICIGTSENGWTDDFLCMEWFRQSFIPQTKARNDSGEKILLIIDGHGSHVTGEMRELAVENNIHLFCLPPHTTHRLQPLDVGVFGPFQNKWAQRCDAVLHETGEEIRRADFVKEYMSVRAQTFSETTIKSAWAKTGINPRNPNIFTDADFAPSFIASTIGHVPESYPTGPLDFDVGGGEDAEQQASSDEDE